MKVGVCFLTLDRFEITRRTILEVLAKTGHSDFELYVCDNGSDDRRTLEFVESLNPFYFRKNPTNEGVSRGFNQLLVRTVKRCDAVVLLGNDIDMPNNWLSTFIDYHQRIGEPTGIIGIECAIPIRQKAMVVNGTKIYAASGTGKSQDGIFGVWYVPKKVIEKVGYFYEFPAPYGLEDSEYNHRVFQN
jgi:glycosyltransferase involved in cell wall biosynthesis